MCTGSPSAADKVNTLAQARSISLFGAIRKTEIVGTFLSEKCIDHSGEHMSKSGSVAAWEGRLNPIC